MTQKTTKQFSPELRERAVRMVQDREREGGTRWESIGAIAAKFGCSRETLKRWVRQGERDAGERPGLTADERERIRAWEREVRQLRKASAYFAQAELDRPLKR
jgi:transposase-like protein